MNKLNLFTAVSLVVASLTGCSDDVTPDFPLLEEEVRVTLTAAPVGSAHSRASVNTTGDPVPLRYVLEYTTPDGTTQRETSVDGVFNLTLKYGNSYEFLFWADNDATNAQYDITDLSAVKIISQPSAPAYSANKTITPGTSAASDYNVTLSHAVAKVIYTQTEVFSVDRKTLNVAFDKSYSFSVADGSVTELSGSSIGHSFADIPAASKDEVIGVSYVFAPADEARLASITTEMSGEGSSHTIPNVPLRRNYVTNIKGNYSDLYNSDISVTTNGNWNTPDNTIEIWDGVSVTIPQAYKGALSANETVEINITKPSEVAWLAQETTKRGVTMKGYTFKLCNDIYLGDHEWTPIGLNEYFAGSIIGSGYAIYGLKIAKSDNRFIGFVGVCDGANNYGLDNLRIYGSIDIDVQDTNNYYIGGICGKSDGSIIQNCESHVSINVNSTKYGAYVYGGGIVGQSQDCKLYANSTYGDIYVNAQCPVNVGGLAGLVRFAYPKEFVGLTFDAGTNVSANVTVENASLSGVIGGYIGQLIDQRNSSETMSFSNIKSSANVTLKKCNMCYAGVWIGRFSSGTYGAQSQLGLNGECQGDIIQENCNRVYAGWMMGNLLLGKYTLTLNTPTVAYTGSLPRFGEQSTDSNSNIFES